MRVLRKICFLVVCALCSTKSNEKIDLRRIWKSTASENCTAMKMTDIYTSIQNNILFNAAICGQSGSLGNSLSNYVESVICANLTGMHVVSQTQSQETKGDFSFPDLFPRYILNENTHSRGNANVICQCKNDICHEHPNALIHSHPHMVRDLLRPLVLAHYDKWLKEPTSETRAIVPWKSNSNDSSNLPLVPEVAIHYRCGDNTVGHYGFLSFPAFSNRIPTDTKTIYVMAEGSARNGSPDRTARCNLILAELWKYLSNHFLNSTVLIIRGADIYDDFVRLAMAKVTICSVSTFCYWPALASENEVYFPITRLIAKATAPRYGPNFHWLDRYPDECVFPGVVAKSMKGPVLVQKLLHPSCHRPTIPDYVLVKYPRLKHISH